MIRLDSSLAAFWENLTHLSRCRLRVETPTASLTTNIDASSAHLSGGALTVPDGGLVIGTSRFEEVYAGTTPTALHMISRERQLGISILPDQKETRRRFQFFAEAFSLGSLPPDFQVERPKSPDLCPCCLEAARLRVRRMAQNPLTAILAHAATDEVSLVATLRNSDGGLTVAHTPVNLLCKGQYLISEGLDDELKISIPHLHAMSLSEELLEGIPHEVLTLLNSHGEVSGILSAPSEEVAGAWNLILSRRDHCYNILDC